jgi:hypothetical protein
MVYGGLAVQAGAAAVLAGFVGVASAHHQYCLL